MLRNDSGCGKGVLGATSVPEAALPRHGHQRPRHQGRAQRAAAGHVPSVREEGRDLLRRHQVYERAICDLSDVDIETLCVERT